LCRVPAYFSPGLPSPTIAFIESTIYNLAIGELTIPNPRTQSQPQSQSEI